MLAEGLLTCSVSVFFASGPLQFFFFSQGFGDSNISVSMSVTDYLSLYLCLFVWAVFLELFRSVALLLEAV